ncbi:hypothetical protein YC2023_029764 [Brassica napus]
MKSVENFLRFVQSTINIPHRGCIVSLGNIYVMWQYSTLELAFRCELCSSLIWY